MSSWRGRVVVLVAVALAVAGCTSGSGSNNEAAPAEVRIGLLAPLSGVNQDAGTDAQRGAQLAADVVNNLSPQVPLPLAADSGLTNLGKARIKIIVADTQSDPQRGVNETVRLVAGQGVAALVGAYDPDVTLAASQRSERFPIPFVDGDSSLSFLTERGLDWFFRTAPSTRTAGESFLSALKGVQKLGAPVPSIGVLYSDDKAGNDISAVISELGDEAGYQVVTKVAFPAAAKTAQDVYAQVGVVKQANPDVVFLAPTTLSAPALVQAFGAKQYRPKAVMAYGSDFLGDKVLKTAGSTGIGLCREVAWSYELAGHNVAAREVDKLYQTKFNSPMTEEAASTFTAVYTLALGLNSAGSTDARRLRSALLSLDVPGQATIMPWQGIQFDETHQNVKASSTVEQFLNRTFHVVYPPDAKTRDLVFPASSAV